MDRDRLIKLLLLAEVNIDPNRDGCKRGEALVAVRAAIKLVESNCFDSQTPLKKRADELEARCVRYRDERNEARKELLKAKEGELALKEAISLLAQKGVLRWA